MTGKQGSSPESIVREIKRQTRRKFTAEEKIRIVLEGLQGEASITDLCRKEGIHPTMYYKWSKAFLFKTFLQESGLSVGTVNSYLVAVKRFFAYLEGRRKYPNVARDVKGIKQPKGHLRESPTVSQVRAMLDGIDRSTLQGKRDFALINLMARTGLRTIEIIRADVEDVKQEAGEALLFVQGKGRDSKDEFVLLTEASLGPLLEYLKARGKVEPGDPLFASHSDRNGGQRLTTRTLRQITKTAFRSIGVDKKKLSAHSLRHFFATQSLKAGAPLLQVKEALRHASVQTTERYLHNIERIEKGAERYIDF